MRLFETNPFDDITMVSCDKCTIWDKEGKAYMDLLSGTWCNVLGYNHPKWIEVVQKQAEKLTHTGSGFMTEEINEGLRKLSEILPPTLNRAVFLNTGSEGVELALKLARAATGADGIVSIDRGYYGATTYAYTISGVGRNAGYLPAIGMILRLTAPDCRNCPMGKVQSCDGKYPCLGALEELVQKGGKQLAAVIYEPVIAGEMLSMPKGYAQRIRELTDSCGALLIAEEVTTGLGRTGRWFGFMHDETVPDILVIGKAIGAGLPVAVVVTTEAVEQRCKELMLRHVQSHQNDPYSGRLAAAVISIMQQELLVELAAERGEYMMNGLRKLMEELPFIVDVRGQGLMLGIELDKKVADKGIEVTRALLEEGYIIGYNPVPRIFRLFPPYIITTEEIDAFLAAFKQVLLKKCIADNNNV